MSRTICCSRPRTPAHLRNHSDDLHRIGRCFGICRHSYRQVANNLFAFLFIIIILLKVLERGHRLHTVADYGDQFLFFLFDIKLCRVPEVDSCLIIHSDRSLPTADLYTNYTQYIIHMIITQRLILLCNYIILYIIQIFITLYTRYDHDLPVIYNCTSSKQCRC